MNLNENEYERAKAGEIPLEYFDQFDEEDYEKTSET